MKEFEVALRLIGLLCQIFIGIMCLLQGWIRNRNKETGFLWISVGFLALTSAAVVWR